MVQTLNRGFGWLVAIVVVAVLVGFGVWWYWSPETPGASSALEGNAAVPSELPSGSNTSDVSLGQDLSAIDAQIGAFGSDSASVSASLSDQQVQQASL